MDEPKKISKLEKLYNEAQEDFKLTQLNLSEKTKEMPAIKNKWIFLYTMEQKRLTKMEETRDTMIEMFVQANSGQRGGEFKAKLDATKQEDILALENKISNQKDVIRFLDLIMQNQIKTILQLHLIYSKMCSINVSADLISSIQKNIKITLTSGPRTLIRRWGS